MTPEQEQLRTRYIDSLEQVERASERTVTALCEAHQALEAIRDLVASGRPLADVEGVVEPGPVRAGVTDALLTLERSRHEAQRLLFRLLQAEGQTLADIGRAYGISRQLVSRLVNEPDRAPTV
jgi:hypothetical protein